jgi:hypothetical protein
MRLILVMHEYAQHNDNQCLRHSLTVANVACLFKAVGDFLPQSCEICAELTLQL